MKNKANNSKLQQNANYFVYSITYTYNLYIFYEFIVFLHFTFWKYSK